MDLSTFVNAVFVRKGEWPSVTDADKEAYFFMFNRYMAKHHPMSAQKFNAKGVDKVSAMDIWFSSLRRQISIPKWFWAGAKPLSRKKSASDTHAAAIAEHHDIRSADAALLVRLYPEDCKAEAARIEKSRKETDK